MPIPPEPPMKHLLTLIAVPVLLAGCATPYPEPQVELAHTPVVNLPPMQPLAPTNGAIYQGASYRPLFEDHRARLVGDTLTVRITERLSASQSSSSEVNRESELSAGVSAFPYLNSSLLGKLQAGATSSNTFNGDGATSANNTFTGNITATVTEVLPNGHLVVIGEKQIGVNQNVDVLQFSGTVDPRTIQPGNTVLSTQLANVRVLSRGRGAQNDAQTFGWLSRFFLMLLPF
jgi:flagellar L-ring protein precursor FlgH